MQNNLSGWARRGALLFFVVALIEIPADAVQKYDGKILFRALFFNSGPVVRVFPELRGSSAPLQPETAAQLERAQAQFLAKLQRADANFFSRFGRRIQSGDRVQIRIAIEEARALVKKVEPGALDPGPKYQFIGHSATAAIRYQFIGQPAQSLTSIQIDQWASLIADRLGPPVR